MRRDVEPMTKYTHRQQGHSPPPSNSEKTKNHPSICFTILILFSAMPIKTVNLRPPITSILTNPGVVHTEVTIWVGGRNAGTLVLRNEEADVFLNLFRAPLLTFFDVMESDLNVDNIPTL